MCALTYHERMRTLRYRSLVGVLALTTFGLAGCGSDDSTDHRAVSQPTYPATASPFPSSQEASITESKQSSQSTPSISQAELTRNNFLERTNGAILRARSYRTETIVEAPGVNETTVTEVVLSLDLDDAVVRTTLPIDEIGTLATVIVLHGMAYMQIPDYVEDKWIMLDGSDPELPTAEDFLGDADPLAVAAKSQNMSAAIIDFTSEPNAETIDGVATTKLTLLLDAEKYFGADPGPMVGETVTVSYFVGPDDLPRRITTHAGLGVVTMNMSRWSEPLDVITPKGNEIITYEKMIELIEQYG